MDDDRSYETCTNPERFEAVVVAARALVDELVATYEVRVEAGAMDQDFPYELGEGEILRLVPAAGGTLAVRFSSFPGVSVRFGRGEVEGFPDCGCDHCDEQPEDMIPALRERVEEYVVGGFADRLTPTTYETWWPNGEGWSRLFGDEWRRYGELGHTQWPAWPRRAKLE